MADQFSPSFTPGRGRIHLKKGTPMIRFTLLLIPALAFAAPELARVVDEKKTLKIRLYGIDAPEKAQAMGKQSGENLKRLCNKKPIRLESKGEDRYKRQIGIVWCGDIEVNRQQVKDGMAWAYTKYSKEYTAEERQARSARVGLWADPSPIAPWEWRKKR